MARLTDKLRYRRNWLNKLVLQVEETQTESDILGMSFKSVKVWRDARVEDLTEIQSWRKEERCSG